MKNKLSFELLADDIVGLIKMRLRDIELDAEPIIESKSLSALAEIQQVIQNDTLSDFEMVEEIVCIFEKYNIDALLFKAIACANLNQDKEMEECMDKIAEINPFLLMEINELFSD